MISSRHQYRGHCERNLEHSALGTRKGHPKPLEPLAVQLGTEKKRGYRHTLPGRSLRKSHYRQPQDALNEPDYDSRSRYPQHY
jgi:hypothetical protein